MEDEKNAAPEVSPLVDYLIREERTHGRNSREIFKASDLRDSLLRKSSESMALKSRDDKGKETVKGKANVRYEANDTFSVSEVRAFDGRFSGDALYTPRQEVIWNWADFPPPEPHNRLIGEERSELQAMAETVMADYLALDRIQRLIAEIDRAEALVDQEWAKEQAMYTAKFEGGGGDGRPHG